MKFRSILALALSLAFSPALAQVTPGSSPLTGPKGGTGNSFMQFTGPATSLKTFTLPNLSDTILTLTGTQSPTNKTIGAGNTLGGVTMGLGSDATGDVYFNNGGVLTRLPKGSNGQALELVSGLPAWATLSGTGTVQQVTCGVGLTCSTNPITTTGTVSLNSHVLLNTVTASGSTTTLSDTTSLTSTYSVYEIIFENIVPATAAGNLELQVHSGGSFQATSYLTQAQANNGGASSFAQPTTFIQIGSNQNNVAPGISGSCRVVTPSSTTAAKQWTCLMAGNNSTPVAVTLITTGFWNNTAAVDGFQILNSVGGNITSGVMKIYGIL